ncbi:MAG: HesA/MoeB/ThiF family protein [Candidatus Kapaibacterium sp.]
MHSRYARHIALPQFSDATQDALRSSKVLVIGAGGLGCPALLYLAAAGVGSLGIVDHDHIELSNLHRQILYTEDDIGKNKASTAAEKLRKINSACTLQVYEIDIHTGNACDIIRAYDIVIDGSDNFPTRYLVNDACAILKIPLVYGSVFRYEGQVSVFHSTAKFQDSQNRPANYRDLFPIPPQAGEVPNCMESGVLGVLSGIIGTMQASEAIKLITGIGDVLAWSVLTYNLLTNSIEQFEFSGTDDALPGAPTTENELAAMHYDAFCGITHDIREISWKHLEKIYSPETMILLDVRESIERPLLEKYPYKSIPLNQLQNRTHELDASKTICVFCQSGARSMIAAHELQNSFNFQHVWNIEGGITAFEQTFPSQL